MRKNRGFAPKMKHRPMNGFHMAASMQVPFQMGHHPTESGMYPKAEPGRPANNGNMAPFFIHPVNHRVKTNVITHIVPHYHKNRNEAIRAAGEMDGNIATDGRRMIYPNPDFGMMHGLRYPRRPFF
ncbi:hypothetical protein [Bacillus sp. 1P06AnD]|uniref:hypothetical protein n=1 Tax=Bacillus sp. 1P06AnD TaxID=3132208 RepID=UPI0039A2D32E